MSVGQNMFDRLIGPIREQMMRTIVRIVGDTDDAADTLQAALMGVWTHLDKIQAHPNPHAYVLRLCISAALDAVRKRARDRARQVPLDSAAPIFSPNPSPAANALAREREQAVHEAIAALPPQQAQAVMLRIIEGEPFDTIARVLDCDEQTARSHVSKGRATLRATLASVRQENAQ